MSKITKKMMNTIHNEMRKRFTPSWERQQRIIRELEDRIYNLEHPPKTTKPVIIEKVPAVLPQPSDEAKHRAKVNDLLVQIVPSWHGEPLESYLTLEQLTDLRRAGFLLQARGHGVREVGHNTVMKYRFMRVTTPLGFVDRFRSDLNRIMDANVPLTISSK